MNAAPPAPAAIGLYGGSFDPVHRGHLLVALAALEELALDRLVFLPAARSPFKDASPPAPGALRLRWLRLALAGHPRFDVDDLEIRRGGLSYSIDTVRTYRQRHPGTRLVWLIGEDQVAELPKWREAPALLELAEFAIIPRPDAPLPPPLPPGGRFQFLKGWPLALSSTSVRDRLALGLPVRHLVPDTVAEALESEAPWPVRRTQVVP